MDSKVKVHLQKETNDHVGKYFMKATCFDHLSLDVLYYRMFAQLTMFAPSVCWLS